MKLRLKPIPMEQMQEPVQNSEEIDVYNIYDTCDAATGTDVIGSGFDHKIVPTHAVAVNLFASYMRQCSNNKLVFQDQFRVSIDGGIFFSANILNQ